MVKFTDEIKQKLIVYRQNGLSKCKCAKMAGINESTLYDWINKGKKAKRGKYREWYLAFEKAYVEFEAYHLQRIIDDDSWQSSAWILERKFKNEYAKQDNHQLEHTGQVTVNKSIKETMEEYENYFKEFEQGLEENIHNNNIDE